MKINAKRQGIIGLTLPPSVGMAPRTVRKAGDLKKERSQTSSASRRSLTEEKTSSSIDASPHLAAMPAGSHHTKKKWKIQTTSTKQNLAKCGQIERNSGHLWLIELGIERPPFDRKPPSGFHHLPRLDWDSFQALPSRLWLSHRAENGSLFCFGRTQIPERTFHLVQSTTPNPKEMFKLQLTVGMAPRTVRKAGDQKKEHSQTSSASTRSPTKVKTSLSVDASPHLAAMPIEST